MKHLMATVVAAILGSMLAGPALAGDRDRSDRERLVREIDKRIDAKLKKFRKELLQDLARLLKARQAQAKRPAPKAAEGRRAVPHYIYPGYDKGKEGAPRFKVLKKEGTSRLRVLSGEAKKKGRVKIRIEKDGKVWEREYDLGKAPFGFKLPDGKGHVQVFKKLEKAGKAFEGFSREHPQFKRFAERGMEEFGKRMRDFDWKAFAERFKDFDRPEDLQRFLQQMFRRFGQGRQGQGNQPQRRRMHRGGKDFDVEVEERVQVRPRVRKRVELRRVPSLESLHKEKAQLERELRELRKLLEKLLKKTRNRRDKDSSDF